MKNSHSMNATTEAARRGFCRAIASNFLSLLLVLMLSGVAHAQFTTSTNNNQITITKYEGPDGAVSIPGTINDLPVTSIGDRVFNGCKGLTSVRIPNSVTSIGDNAFNNCTSLTSVTVEASNPAFSSVDGVLFNKNQTTLIQCPEGKAGSYVIPNSVTSIGKLAFSGCKNLTSVTIPNSVTSIGNAAFWFCKGLTSVTIPNSVTNIRELTFSHCTSLASVTIPNSVTDIWGLAFSGCTSLTSVTIPDSVTGISGNAFSFCKSLTSAVFMGKAPIMGAHVFDKAAPDFKISYSEGAKGFSSPKWEEYPSQMMKAAKPK